VQHNSTPELHKGSAAAAVTAGCWCLSLQHRAVERAHGMCVSSAGDLPRGVSDMSLKFAAADGASERARSERRKHNVCATAQNSFSLSNANLGKYSDVTGCDAN